MQLFSSGFMAFSFWYRCKKTASAAKQPSHQRRVSMNGSFLHQITTAQIYDGCPCISTDTHRTLAIEFFLGLQTTYNVRGVFFAAH
jgi:hypothetical protein